MALTTLDAIAAGRKPPVNFRRTGSTMEAAGVLHSLFYTNGFPGPASAPSPGLGGAALSSTSALVPGQLPFTDSTDQTVLFSFEAAASNSGTLYLVDRLWHNSGLTITQATVQALTFSGLPARDDNGTTTGHGVMIGLECSGATGNGAAISNTTCIYTSSDNAPTKTATLPSWPQTAQAGTFVPFDLAAGDRGVKSITSITLGNSYSSGTVHLVAYRILAQISCPASNIGTSKGFFELNGTPLYNGSVPQLLWLPIATSATTIHGSVSWSQG